jgi:hypothetical protein
VIVTIMQPAYLPWLGFFDRVLKSDLLVVLDHVAIDRNSRTKYANRNRIRVQQGSIWLTVPVLTKHRGGDLALDHLEIDNAQRWQVKHWRSIESNYRRAPFFDLYAPSLEPFFLRRWERLASLDDALVQVLFDHLGVSTPRRKSSAMGVESSGTRLILDLCRSVGARTYISGPFGREYLDLPSFRGAGIEVRFHDYPHPRYRQVYDGFEPFMSVLDLLFNEGPQSLGVLRSDERSLAYS